MASSGSAYRRESSPVAAAEVLGVNERTLRRWCSAGAPHTRKKNGDLRVNADEISAWMKTTGRSGEPGRPIENEDADSIERIVRNPERVARIKLLVAREAKLRLETSMQAGGYIPKEDVERDRLARVYSVRARLMELPRRAALIANRSEEDCERLLGDWAREICDHYAREGD